MTLIPGLQAPERRDFFLFRLTFLSLFLFETASFIVFLTPWLGNVSFLLAVVVVLALAFWRFDWAVTILLIELCVGSQGGYLLSLPIGGLQLSLRMLLFVAVVGVWLARSVVTLLTRRGTGLDWWRSLEASGLLLPFGTLCLVFAFAFVNGYLRGNGFGNVFFDGNGYVYYAALPALLAGLSDAAARRRALVVMSAALTWSLTKAFIVLFVFSHRIMAIAPDMYVWVRDTRVGEITRMAGDFYRVFFQSHVFALPALFAAMTVLLMAADWRDRAVRPAWFVYLTAATALIMGFSRSFWFGGTVAAVAFLIWASRSRLARNLWLKAAALAGSAVLVAVLVMASVYAFPFPARTGSISFAALLGGRATSLSDDAAAMSRWALLPKLMEVIRRHPFVGSGFGTTVTYTTSDPRILALIPSGQYSTYAFEWGWHDLWLKLGLGGLAVLAWFLWIAVRPAVRYLRRRSTRRFADFGPEEKQKAAVAAAVCAAFVALLATNVFSPYLNHPLGIGILALTISFAAVLADQMPSNSVESTKS